LVGQNIQSILLTKYHHGLSYVNDIKNMKYILTLILFTSFSFSSLGQENDPYTFDDGQSSVSPGEKNRSNYFYFSPFQVFSSIFQVAYERDGGTQTIKILAAAILKDGDNEFRKGFGGSLQMRFHLFKSAAAATKRNSENLIYFGPYLQYQYVVNETTDTETVEYFDEKDKKQYYEVDVFYTDMIQAWAGGIVFGLRSVIFDKLVIDLYAGGGLKYSEIVGNESNYFINGFWSLGYTGVYPKLGMDIGVNF